MRVSIKNWLLTAAGMAVLAAPAQATKPYMPVPATGSPVVGPGVMPPDMVYGKEYSHDFDQTTMGGGGLPDPQQVIAWDGIGGAADSVDYTGTRPDWQEDQQVDAIANTRDALYDQTLRDESHLIFSHDDLIAGYGTPSGGLGLVSVSSSGPIMLSNGNFIGGAGEVTVEESGMFAGPSIQYTWAKQPEVNMMPLPVDVDGLEVWGPEPRRVEEPDLPVFGDADKYSLDVDVPSGHSVWNASGSSYIDWPTIVSAVESKLGPVPPTAFSMRDDHQGRQAINLDALMVSDIIGDRDIFDRDGTIGGPNGEDLLDQNGDPIEPFGLDGEMRGDSIIFSIRQVVDPSDPSGYYATGSELFVLDSFGGVSFLKHGGHAWDKGYALTELALFGTPDQEFEFGVIDINAIEAIGEDLFSPPVGLPGDFNGDGTVDSIDYAVWRENLGTAFPLAGNGDESGASVGTVDQADFSLWLANYGAPLPSPAPVAAGSAPEPATAWLVLGALGLAAVRRRK